MVSKLNISIFHWILKIQHKILNQDIKNIKYEIENQNLKLPLLLKDLEQQNEVLNRKIKYLNYALHKRTE
jgi:hypothetical protein